MSKLNNIIFDLGAVLYDIDFKKTAEAFKSLGFTDFDNMYTQYHVDEVFEKIEIGAISQEAFCQALMQKNSSLVTPQQIIDAWNAILVGWRKDSVAHLQLLAQKI